MSPYLRASLETGAAAAAAKLTKLSRTPWSVEAVELDGPPEQALSDLLSAVPQDHHGSCVTMTGGALLVLFPLRAGMLVAHRFTSPHSEEVDLLEEPERQALAEVSSMVANAIAGALADALGRPLKMKPPDARVTSQRDHVVRAIKSFEEPAAPTHTASVLLRAKELAAECRVILLVDAAKVGLSA